MVQRGMSSRKILSGSTPLSMEREFAVYHKSGDPFGKPETDDLILRLRRVLSRIPQQTEVVEEVAANSIELKVCFSTIGGIRNAIKEVYRIFAEEIDKLGVYVIGISQPKSSDAISHGMSHFMTVDIFKQAAISLAAANSMHLHIGVETEADAVALYAAGNLITPLTLALSQCAIVDGQERGRAHLLRNFYTGLPNDLVLPWTVETISDFELGMERARIEVEKIVCRMSSDERAVLSQRYPTYISADGAVMKLTPDKVFHPLRMRPDKAVTEKHLFGSVEYRAIDGQATMHADLAHIEFVMGLLSYELGLRAGAPLVAAESQEIIDKILSIADTGLSGIVWNGISNPADALGCAVLGLADIGIQPQYLFSLPFDGGNSEFSLMRGLSREEVIQMNHIRFMSSVLSPEH